MTQNQNAANCGNVYSGEKGMSRPFQIPSNTRPGESLAEEMTGFC